MKNLITRLIVLLIGFAVAGGNLYSCKKEDTPDPTQKRIAELQAKLATLADEVRAAVEPAKTAGEADISNYFNSEFAAFANKFYGISMNAGERVENLADSARIFVWIVEYTYLNNGNPLPLPLNHEAMQNLHDKSIAYLAVIHQLNTPGNHLQGTTGPLTWKISSDKVLTVSGAGAMPDYDKTNDLKLAPWKLYRDKWNKAIIENGVTSISTYAFSGCVNLVDISIPNSIAHIGVCAFLSCLELKSITLPNGLQSIENGVFSNCKSLNSIVIHDNITKINMSAFSFTGLKTLDISQYATSLTDTYAIFSTPLTGINVAAENPNYLSIDGVLFNKAQDVLLVYPSDKEGATYIIPDGVTELVRDAFSGNKKLVNITIPASVAKIEHSTFNAYFGCSIKNVTILATTPPELGTYNFGAEEDTLYVPAGSLDAYQNDAAWSAAFTTITTIPL